MPDLFSGSQYSSGWKPISRSDENATIYNSEIEEKLKTLTEDFSKFRYELDEKIKNTNDQSTLVQVNLRKEMEELTSIITMKDEEIKRLTEEKFILKAKYEMVYEQLLCRNKGFIESLIKKITIKKSHQNEHMHSID